GGEPTSVGRGEDVILRPDGGLAASPRVPCTLEVAGSARRATGSAVTTASTTTLTTTAVAPAASRLVRAPRAATTPAPTARPARLAAWKTPPAAANVRPRLASSTRDRTSALTHTRCSAFAVPPSTQPTPTTTIDGIDPAPARPTPMGPVDRASARDSARSPSRRPPNQPPRIPAAGHSAVTTPYAPGPAPT